MKQAVLVNGMPKAGTNLLKSALSLVPGYSIKSRYKTLIHSAGLKGRLDRVLIGLARVLGRPMVGTGVDWPRQVPAARAARLLRHIGPGRYIQFHWPYSPRAAELVRVSGVCMLVMVRDPRAVALSFVHHAMKRPEHFMHRYFHALDSDHERLMVAIQGLPPSPEREFFLLDIGSRLQSMLDWEQEFPGRLFTFEGLIGPKGGGDPEAQRAEVRKLLALLGEPVEQDLVERIAENLFGIGSTFRAGQVDQWKQAFAPEHKAAAKEVCGDLLLKLGYETTGDW